MSLRAAPQPVFSALTLRCLDMIATYHNHSRYSDGRATIAELVDAARTQGIEELGVSDHFTLHPDGIEPPWSMKPSLVNQYVAELQELAQPNSGPAIRIGLEVDWFTGHARRIADTLAPLPLDYVIGSVHYVGGSEIDSSSIRWERMSQPERDGTHEQYWRHMADMARSGIFDIVAHMDLPKKFGYRASHDVVPLIHAALDAIADAPRPLVVELNTAGWFKPCQDAYPTLDILRECRSRDIPVTISADAHHPDHLLRGFDRAAERLIAAGYDEIARFCGREMHMDQIRQAVRT